MKLHATILCLATMLFAHKASAQAPSVKSVLTMGGAQNDIGRLIKYTSDGGYIAMGTTNSDTGDVTGFHETYAGTSRDDAWLWRVNANGTIKWKKCLLGFYEDNPIDVFENADSSLDVFLVNYLTMLMVKLDKNGNVTKTKSFYRGFYVYNQSTLTKSPFAVAKNKNGGYAIAMEYGNLDSAKISGFHGKGTESSDILFFTINDTGKVLNTKCLGGRGLDAPYALMEKQSGGYFLLGRTTSFDGDATGRTAYSKMAYKLANFPDVWILSLNTKGDTIWQKSLGGENADYGYSFIESGTGQLVFCGQTGSDSGVVFGHTKNDNIFDIPDAWICSFDTLTKKLSWQYTSATKGNDYAMDIKKDNVGNLVVAGSMYNLTDLVFKTTLLGLSSNGQFSYQYIPPVNKTNYGLGMDINPNNSILLCGYTDDRSISSFFKSKRPAEMFVIQFNGYTSSSHTRAVSRENNFTVFPVPAANYAYFQISTQDLNKPLIITDISGKIIQTITLTHTHTALSLGSFQNGIYIATLENKSLKFVVEK